MTRMTSDLAALEAVIGQGSLNIVRAIFAFSVAFSIMFFINVTLASAVLILLPTMTVLSFTMLWFLRPYYQSCQEQFSALSSFAQQSFLGIRLIKGFGIEDDQDRRFKTLNDGYVSRSLKLSKLESPLWPLMGFCITFSVISIVWVGGKLVINGAISLGTLVQFQQYLMFLLWPTLSLGWTMSLIQKGRVSWERVRAILDAQAIIKDNEQTKQELELVTGDIEFRHVSVAFDGKQVLKDIQLSIPEGMTIGLTGPTGSGKSTLASLLVRKMDPDSGHLFIGMNDLKEIPLNILRRDVRFSPQETFLFSNTLQKNISMGDTELSEEHVLWAANIAQLSQEAEDFPAGFNTIVGERGVTLSGGQRQRSAIARAIINNPQVLVLDDTLSAVDTHTEEALINNLRPLMKERTTLLISHRVSTLRHSDFVVVLEDGEITQLGAHKDLIEQDGYYRDIDQRQKLEAQLEEL